MPFRQINVATEVDGKAVFKAPEARAGNFVRKGQVLYRIDPRDYELAVQRLESMLEQEQAAIKELDQEVANANRMITVNKEELALHDANLNRLQSLRDGVASRAEIDDVRRARLVTVKRGYHVSQSVADLRNASHTVGPGQKTGDQSAGTSPLESVSLRDMRTRRWDHYDRKRPGRFVHSQR